MKPKNNISMIETLKALIGAKSCCNKSKPYDQWPFARKPKRRRWAIKNDKKKSRIGSHECWRTWSIWESLLALWTPRIALENQIDRLSTEYTGQLEIFNKLKNPDAPENSRLKDSILSLKYRIEDLKDKLDDLIQNSRLNNDAIF